MFRYTQSKLFRYFIIMQILLMSLGWSQESTDNLPCKMANYDAEHHIVRSYEMIVNMYENDAGKIADYIDCYHKITGVDLAPKNIKLETIIIVLVVLGLIGGGYFIFGNPNLGGELNISGDIMP
ncbi:MAG: hypothetical protein K9M55_07380 [Candidatus Marinimicrobia bacterium]|nr:hypothetical protein [Candidatus Neomarinimicrobiota bacterium]